MSTDRNLAAIGEAVSLVLQKYQLPFAAIADLFEIASLTAKWQANGVLRKLAGAPGKTRSRKVSACPLN